MECGGGGGGVGGESVKVKAREEKVYGICLESTFYAWKNKQMVKVVEGGGEVVSS